MAYCTPADILGIISEETLIQLTDDDDNGSVDMDKVDAAIADADAEVNGYCGARYGVPFSPVPAIVKKLSTDIAIYNLFALRESVPDPRVKRYDNAIKFLTQVAAGKISLGVSDPDGTPAKDERPDIASDDRLFDREKMSGF